MQSKQIGPIDFSPAGDDHIVPFHVEALDVRGRAAQLGPMLETITDNRDYPQPVARLLAEIVVLSALLGSSLKFDGRFVIQTRSDGPVSLLIADFVTPGAMRAYAGFDEVRLKKLVEDDDASPRSLMGAGTLAMTIDQGTSVQRYQGIVSLDGLTLEEAACQYFRQSGQIPTKIILGAAQSSNIAANGNNRTTWRSGGVMIQFLPEKLKRNGANDSNETNDRWREALSLIGSVGVDELTNPEVGAERLLYRLFHERGVRAHPASRVIGKCGCSRQKIVEIIKGFSPLEREEAVAASGKPGIIVSKCEFCGASYEIGIDETGA